jgi:hypothetical protein
MADSNSGRNEYNAGSDSKPHYGSTPSAEYDKAGSIGKATGDTGKLSNGYVGNGMRAPSNPKSVVKT